MVWVVVNKIKESKKHPYFLRKAICNDEMKNTWLNFINAQLTFSFDDNTVLQKFNEKYNNINVDDNGVCVIIKYPLTSEAMLRFCNDMLDLKLSKYNGKLIFDDFDTFQILDTIIVNTELKNAIIELITEHIKHDSVRDSGIIPASYSNLEKNCESRISHY